MNEDEKRFMPEGNDNGSENNQSSTPQDENTSNNTAATEPAALADQTIASKSEPIVAAPAFEFTKPSIDLFVVKDGIAKTRTEVKKFVIGQEDVVDLILISIFCSGHVLLEGVPGIAKTLSAKVIAKTLSAEFSRIQFTPDLMPSDIIGTSIYNMKSQEFDFKKGPIFSNLILIDEINRAPAKTQAALFEVMEEQQLTYDGTTYKLDYPFMVIATQNPVEQEGTYNLPEAQLGPFSFQN